MAGRRRQPSHNMGQQGIIIYQASSKPNIAEQEEKGCQQVIAAADEVQQGSAGDADYHEDG